VWEAIGLANRHPRVNILSPGPGVGGHCISVDPWFLVEAAPDITALIRTARNVNDAQPQQVVELARQAVGELRGCRVAALGLAYKADVDDLRESPAIEVVQRLGENGAQVLAYEPLRLDAAVAGIQAASTLEEALRGADLVLLLVGHTPLKQMDPLAAAALMRGRIAMDAVNGWNTAAWQNAGFRLHRLGAGNRQGAASGLKQPESRGDFG